MDSIAYVDRIVREYLLFRGFVGAVRAFDSDATTADRNVAYDADKITSMLLSYAQSLDHAELTATWSYFDTQFFIRLPSAVYKSSVRRLFVSLQRYFIICAVQQKKLGRIQEFFEAHPELTSDPDWSLWFALPFAKRPESDPRYQLFFSKIWLEIFTTSLRNFIGFVFANLPLPVLLNFNVERVKRKTLELEVDKLREEVADLKERLAKRTSQLRSAPSVTSLGNAAASMTLQDDEPFIILHEDRLTLHDNTAVKAASLAGDGTMMASVDFENGLRVWNQLKPTLPIIKLALPAECSSLNWGSQGNAKLLYLGTSVGTVKAYSVDSRLNFVRELKCPLSVVTSVHAVGSNLLMASLSSLDSGPSKQQGAIALWSLRSWELETTINLPEAVNLMHCNRSGTLAIACSLSGAAFVLDLSSRTVQHAFTVDGHILAVAMASDSTALHLVLQSGQLIKYSLDGIADPLQTHMLTGGSVSAATTPTSTPMAAAATPLTPPTVRFSPGADYVLVGTTVYRVATGKAVHTMEQTTWTGTSLACVEWQGNTWAHGLLDGSVHVTKLMYA
ncbi:hypothetical protein RI367_003313 [Sorochytrium milnesiophthora]